MNKTIKVEPEARKYGTGRRGPEERGEGGEGERRGRLWSRNRFKWPVDMDNCGGIDWGRLGVGAGESSRGKIGAIVIEQ